MFAVITSNLLWSQGTIILLIIVICALVGWFYSKILLALALLSFAFCFYFFRNPERICKQALDNPHVLVCPADGTIVGISYDANSGFDGYAQKIAIFLSPLDVHVNWIPMSGIVEKITYKRGSFMPAFLPKSSELNERNDIIITAENGRSVLVRQIAGTVARRIVCWTKEGQSVAVGQKYGMIKFSSRVEILLPKNVKIEVGVGQKVYGGQSVLGIWQ